MSANIDNALSDALSFKPLRDTILETLRWRKPVDLPLKAGITAEREIKLLGKLRLL